MSYTYKDHQHVKDFSDYHGYIFHRIHNNLQERLQVLYKDNVHKNNILLVHAVVFASRCYCTYKLDTYQHNALLDIWLGCQCLSVSGLHVSAYSQSRFQGMLPDILTSALFRQVMLCFIRIVSPILYLKLYHESH